MQLLLETIDFYNLVIDEMDNGSVKFSIEYYNEKGHLKSFDCENFDDMVIESTRFDDRGFKCVEIYKKNGLLI